MHKRRNVQSCIHVATASNIIHNSRQLFTTPCKHSPTAMNAEKSLAKAFSQLNPRIKPTDSHKQHTPNTQMSTCIYNVHVHTYAAVVANIMMKPNTSTVHVTDRSHSIARIDRGAFKEQPAIERQSKAWGRGRDLRGGVQTHCIYRPCRIVSSDQV